MKVCHTIQQRIRTLSENAVGMENGANPSFMAEDVKFTHWDFNHRDGWVIDAWLAAGDIEAEDGPHALLEFQKKIFKIIPRVSLIGQAYIQYLVQLLQTLPNTIIVRLTNTTSAYFKQLTKSRATLL